MNQGSGQAGGSSIEETLLSELSVKCLIGIGSVSSQMKDIAKSFKEATTAIEVGAVFDTEKNIISFENLGIGRLIYQLPITLCECSCPRCSRRVRSTRSTRRPCSPSRSSSRTI